MIEKRYFLYLDILGFAELIELFRDSPKDIYNILDTTVWSASYWSERTHKYSTLSFSDTILFWQEEPNNDYKSFSELCSLGSLIQSTIMGFQIPVRGIIVYNDLHVKLDREYKKHPIFFGNGLIEAYKSEKKENWMGISVNPSALENITKEQIDEGIKKRRWVHREGSNSLLLNPFQFSNSFWDKDEKKNYASFIATEARALKYMLTMLNEYKIKNDYSSRVASKYFTTNNFYKSILEKNCYNWLVNKANKMDFEQPIENDRQIILE